jgi:hypothetical protein
MRRRSNSHSPISLFTFLDTLVCTMGSLILMLLAMTPKIKERAEARELARLAALSPAAAPAVADAAPAVAPPAEDEQDRAAARQKRREAWLASAAQARAELAKKQADYHQQRQLLKTAAAKLKELEDKKLDARLKLQSAEDTSQTLSDLETKLEQQEAAVAQKIAQTRKSLDLLNRKQAAAANEYALVPYDGTSGTVRRPVYLECSKRGFRFLPEDETLSPVDLEGFRESYNPLLNGTQALLRFWSRKRRESGGAEPEPYVLLLVRPSGCLNYYLAREFLSSLGANFGYELIEEDWKLSIPAADPIAKTVLKETLDLTVQAHGQMKDVLAEAAQRGSFGGVGRNGGRGGLDDSWPDDDGDDFGGSSFGNSRGDRRPRVRLGPPTRAYRDSAGPGYGSAGGEYPPGSTGSRGDSATGTGKGSGIGQGTPPGKPGAGRAAGIGGGAKPGDSTRGGRAGAVGGDGGGDGGGLAGDEKQGATGGTYGSRKSAGLGSAGGAGDGADSDAASTGDGGAGGSSAGNTNGGLAKGGASRSGIPGRPGRPAARPASISGSGADGVGGDGGSDGDAPLELPADYAPGQLPGGDSAGAVGDGDSPLSPLPQGGADRSGRASAGTAGGGAPRGSKTSAAGSNTSGSSTSSRTGAPAGQAGADDSESGDAGMTGVDLGASGSDGGPSSPIQMGGPGANIRLGSKTKRSSSTKDDDSDSGPRLSDPDAKKGGGTGRARGPRLWGRARPKATIGLEKKIEIRVLADRIMVGSKDIVIPVGRGEKVEEMIDRVVVGIDHHVSEKWGDPPESFYWVPTAKFVVYPGGNLYYERLRGPLEHKWGVVSTVEYAPDPKPATSAAGGRP